MKGLVTDLIRHPLSMMLIGGVTIYIAESAKVAIERKHHREAIRDGKAYPGYEFDGLFIKAKILEVKEK